MELGNVLKVTYGAHVIVGAYNAANEAADKPSEVLDDESMSVIQYLLHGKMAEGRQNKSYANEAISVGQAFAEPAASISEKYARMKELAEQAASGSYSAEEVAQMQEEFEQLAEEINSLANGTEHNGNKLFTAEGETISISIGKNSAIDIFARDLTIDIEGLDLTTDAEGVLSAIQSKVSSADYYSGYLEDQVAHLQRAVNLIEFEVNNDLGVEAEDFDMELAKEVAGYAASQTLSDFSVLFDTQANVEPERALQLLKDVSKSEANVEEE